LQQSDLQTWHEVIDFKKQKINWRFKSRVRSNSTEFIEGLSVASQPPHRSSRKPDTLSNSSTSLNMMSGKDDFDEPVVGTLVCGASTQFKIIVEATAEQCQELLLQISVWPTMRMPTGTCSIPLINNSFLFAKRNHDEESQEIDFLVAQALLNARKFI
jgi:hypothetical protein